jgi:hypothetical protein
MRLRKEGRKEKTKKRYENTERTKWKEELLNIDNLTWNLKQIIITAYRVTEINRPSSSWWRV